LTKRSPPYKILSFHKGGGLMRREGGTSAIKGGVFYVSRGMDACGWGRWYLLWVEKLNRVRLKEEGEEFIHTACNSELLSLTCFEVSGHGGTVCFGWEAYWIEYPGILGSAGWFGHSVTREVLQHPHRNSRSRSGKYSIKSIKYSFTVSVIFTVSVGTL